MCSMATSTGSWPPLCRNASPARRSKSRMSSRLGIARVAGLALALVSCRATPSEPQFPKAHREVAPIIDDSFSTEDARDRLGEAEEVMTLAGIKPGMSVADVGAGEGYYTVRLARIVGA